MKTILLAGATNNSTLNPSPIKKPLALLFLSSFSSMPSPPPPTHDDTYSQLISALHPPPPIVPEIEILPSSFPPKILHESAAVGVPKSLLVSLYLQARKIFFDHISTNDSNSYHAALEATPIILLFDPNHLTAANFRKRHIERFSDGRTVDNDRGNEDLAGAVQNELRFLESLVTSPLSKHAKSSTLWPQRLWIVQNFPRLAVGEHATDEELHLMNVRHGLKGFWDKELAVAMKAAERHPRNYYAWQYARELFSLVCSEGSGLVGGRQRQRVLLRDGIGRVRAWCLMHPRDISGWAFLVFLLEQLRNDSCDEAANREMENEIRTSSRETKEFTKRYGWKGESIEWFLNAMKTLNVDE